MNARYVAKALVYTGSDAMDGEQGPFYRYFSAAHLDDAVQKAFNQRNALFAGGVRGGSFADAIMRFLNLESVYALAVKEVRTTPWQVLLDMRGEFLAQQHHQKRELEIITTEYGPSAFKSRAQYVSELMMSELESY